MYCISTAVKDNSSASWFGMSNSELVMEVSHALGNILVCSAVTNTFYIYFMSTQTLCLFHQTLLRFIFRNVHID